MPEQFRKATEQLRADNLARVLTLVHHHGPLSRAQITRDTGLNRSTVGQVVSDLVLAGWVRSRSESATTGVGRPSPLVEAVEDVVVLAVNPEVDGIELALVGLGGVVRARAHIPGSAADPDWVVRAIQDALPSLRAQLRPPITLLGAAAAVPGLVDTDGVVRVAPHLGWREVRFAELLSEALGLPAQASNDAHLGALAEQTFGGARGVADFVYLNGGASGIGGGIVAGGVPLGGAAGFAGEWGHMVVASDSRWSDAEGASLERLVNRSRLLDAAGLAASPEQADDALQANEAERALAELARRLRSLASTSGDDGLRDEVDRQLLALGTALRNAVNVLNPSLVLLGGFLADLSAAVPGALEQQIRSQALAPAAELVRVVEAQLGRDILLIGAAELVFQQHFSALTAR